MDTTSKKFLYLLEANRILSSTLNLPDLLRQVMELAMKVVEAESSSLLMYDEKTSELYFDLALTEKESQLKSIRIKSGEGIAGWVAANKRSRIVNNVDSDSQWMSRADEHTKFKTRSLIAVPLIFKGKLLGVVEAVNRKSGEFGAEDYQTLEAFAAQAAVAIENARLFINLHEEKEKIEAVFSQMSDGAIFVDAAGVKILANAAAKKLVGEENISKDTVSKIFGEFSSQPPLDEIISGSEKSRPFEMSRVEGKTFFISGNANRILNSSGEIIGLIFVFRNVTEEKKESMLKKNFFSLMSHKLKTPLVTIAGYGPLLLETPLNDMQKKAITAIHKQGAYLAGLVDKLLYSTIAETGNLTINKGPQTLAELTDKAVAALKQYLEQKSAEIIISGKIKSLPVIMMDGETIEVTIRSLIENAVKFNKGAKPRVEIEPKIEKGFAGLAISDNGPGIPPEEREKVFQKFYQIEESFTGQVEGAGLGLSLVKQVVEAHGGRVGLESAKGKGSKFYFLLPVS
ncbi:MAG: ATP-binding protein [Elusimicrobiota bacterium]